MKKTLAMLLAVLMLLGCLVACSAEPTAPAETPAAPTETPATTPSEPADEPADEPVEEPADEPVEEPVEEPAASVYPICAPGEITVEWFAGDKTNNVLQLAEADFSQNVFWQWITEVTGVQIKWNILSGDTYNEQFNLMLVSEDYPDIANGNVNLVNASPDLAYEDGVLVDLAEHIDWIPNYKASLDIAMGGYKGHLTDGGRLLGFWQLRDRTQPSFLGYFVRQDWLNDLGLELPTTLDEWTTVLTAFRDNKTSGKGPMTYDAGGLPPGNWFARAYGVNAQSTISFMLQRDGVVACSAIEDGYRSMLELLSGWYADGLIDQDFAGRTGWNYLNPMIDAEEVGIWYTMFRYGGTYMRDSMGLCANDEDFYAVKLPQPTLEEGGKNMIGDRGEIASIMGMMGSMIFAESEHVEASVKMIDYVYSEEGTLHANWGWEGVHFEYDENGKPYYLPWMKDPDQGTNRELYLIHSRPKMDLMDGIEDGLPEDALDYYDVWDEVGAWNLPALTFTAEEAEEMGSIANDINTYVQEFTIKTIVGQQEINDQTWAEYISALEGMGVAKLVELYQAAFDRFMAR